MPLLRERIYTIEDIYALPEGERAELIDGHIYYMAPPNTMHQRISSILSRKIGNYIDSNKGKCEVFAAPFAVYLDEKTNTYVEPDVSVICDPDKLERVVDNLIRNAISYSYPNTAISLEMHTTEEYAVLTICNTGRTISPEKLDRIFEQFFRGDSSRATATGGAGLGLAIAKQITELHGGTIKADSRNEQIRFTVTLPLRQKIV